MPSATARSWVVFHDQVLVEEADRLLAGRGRQADEVGVEIVQHLPPDGVDGAVALVDDDEVEEFDGQHAAEADRARRAAAAPLFLPLHRAKLLFRLFFQLLILEHGVEPLDGADVDAVDVARQVDRVVGQVADVVELAELAAVVGRLEADELVVGLLAQIVAVDQEQHAPRVGWLIRR